VHAPRAATDRRPHRLLLAERPGEQLFPVELDALSRRLDLVVTRTGGRRLDPAVLAEVVPPRAPDRHDYFVCGSPSLVEAALAALAVLGVPDARVHTERF
jgi:ferredoxin-NADP reductase